MFNAQGLRKSYGARVAVADVSLSVGAGQVLGLLGPNGAGKSSTVGMLCGLVTPDAGTVSLAGTASGSGVDTFKRRIGLVPQDIALYEDLSALANLELFGALYGVPQRSLRGRAVEVLGWVGLAERAHDKPATFSGGMKRRLNIACALVHDPDVLLFDEPTAGVDPQSRNAIFDTLETLKRQGKAIVYTTHYMEEVERLADQIVIIDHGRVVARGSLGELLRTLPAAETLELECEGPVDTAALSALPGVKQVTHRRGRVSLGIDALTHVTPSVMQTLANGGASVRSITSGRANLEDVFLALTGRQLRD